MKKISTVFIAFLYTLCQLAAQQEVHFDHGCNFVSGRTSGDYTLFNPSTEAEQMVNSILDVFRISPRPFTLKAADVDNAQATVLNKERYLLYSNTFLRSAAADAQTKWAAIGVFAHEIGHHVLLQDLSETDPKKRRGFELAADLWAAKVLARLGANKEEALAAIKTLKLDTDPGFYPSIQARMEGMESAYGEEFDKIKTERNKDKGQARTTLNIDPASYNRWSIVNATSVNASFDDEKVTIDVTIPSMYYNKPVTIQLCSNDPNMPVRTLKGVGDRLIFNAGNNSRRIIWNFLMDEVTLNLASRANQLKVFIYSSADMPSVRGNKGLRTVSVISSLAGIGLTAYSFKLRSDAKADWNANYADTRLQSDYDRADKKHLNSQFLLAGGGVILATGISLFIAEKRKRRQAKAAICYQAPRWRFEPVLASGQIPGAGLSLRF